MMPRRWPNWFEPVGTRYRPACNAKWGKRGRYLFSGLAAEGGPQAHRFPVCSPDLETQRTIGNVQGGPREPSDHGLGLGRGGISTKLHLVTDSNGLPLAAMRSPGQRHEVPVFPALMDGVRVRLANGRTRSRPGRLAGDKAYGYEPVYRYLRRRGIAHAIPQRSGPGVGRLRLPVDPDTYRRRNAVERCVGWLKGCRSAGTRYDKLATSFLAMVKLAFMRQYLRALRPSDRT